MKQTFSKCAVRGWLGTLLVVGAVVVVGACGGDGSGRSWTPTVPGGEVIGSGQIVTVSRVVQGFSAVSLTAAGVVTIDRTGSESLRITADDNIIPLLTSLVSGGELSLGVAANNGIDPSQDIVFEVTARQLDEVSLHGAGVIEASRVDTGLFTVDLTGVGTIAASGRADRQDVALSGVGDYAAPNLRSRVATVSITGVGTAIVRVSERLSGFVGFGCSVEYYGDPIVDVTGSGTVRRLGP